MASLESKLLAANGQPAGFDYLRIGLALTILVFHTVVTSRGLSAQADLVESPFGAIIDALLPMFFALSGYLVAGSLARSSGVVQFIGMRVLRIFPALAVDTIFCALILGPIFTSLPLSAYFASESLWTYFLNMLGIIHYYLPGVFLSNPITMVNGQLWTLPAELECYLVLSVLFALGLHRRRLWILGLVLALFAVVEWRVIGLIDAKVWWNRVLLLSFLSAVVIRLYHDRIVWSIPLVLLSLVSMVVLLQFPPVAPLGAIPAAYFTVGLGLIHPRRVRWLSSGDYSYGMFLYGFAVQQAVVAAVPAARDWFVNLVISVPLTFVFAYLSWHVVEKRALSLRRFLNRKPI